MESLKTGIKNKGSLNFFEKMLTYQTKTSIKLKKVNWYKIV